MGINVKRRKASKPIAQNNKELLKKKSKQKAGKNIK